MEIPGWQKNSGMKKSWKKFRDEKRDGNLFRSVLKVPNRLVFLVKARKNGPGQV